MKTVLITGGSSGLGRELAIGYGKKGYKIIVVGRDSAKLINTTNYLSSQDILCSYMIMDVGRAESVRAIKERLIEEKIDIDVVVNCAGVGCFGELETLNIDDINRAIDINLKGTILVTKIFLDSVRERFVNIISTAGLRGKVNESVYCASKYGVRGFTEALQLEYQDKPLNFTAVYMGGMNTPFWDDNAHISDKSRLRDPRAVAKEIIDMDDGRKEIIIQ